jgi:radical SAM protein with 4Fe4S-binding SPASM domain
MLAYSDSYRINLLNGSDKIYETHSYLNDKGDPENTFFELIHDDGKFKLFLKERIKYIHKPDTKKTGYDEEKSAKLLGKVDGVKNCLDVIKYCNEINLFVHINMTLNNENCDEIEKFKEILKRKNIEMRVNPYFPFSDMDKLSPIIVKKAYEIVEKMKKAGFPIYMPVEADETYPEAFLCSGGLTRATVENNGKIGGCQFIMNKYGPKGSVVEDGLYNLWLEGDFDVFRNEIKKPRPECKICEYRPFCVTNCLAVHVGLSKGDEYCPLTN